MKILFLCGSLEPGCDGVGDYVRKMGGELVFQGHHVALMALNDRHVSAAFDGFQKEKQVSLPVFRLSSYGTKRHRLLEAKKWIKKFDPDWVSLQFVPFSYHSKGLPFGMGGFFHSLTKGRHLQIMFHELWVGMDLNSSWKYRFWGKLQKFLILLLVKKLKPALIHTQTRLYQLYLSQMGIHAKYLPLFSNISNLNLYNTMMKNKCLDKSGISMVLFGGIFPGTPVEIFSEEAGRYSRETGITITLIITGRSGEEQKKWESCWHSAGLPVENLGERSEEQLSAIFSSSHFGISTTPLPLIEKSGSVAAMQAHGLPIISVARRWRLSPNITVEVPKGVMEYQLGKLSYCIRNVVYPNIHKVSSISQQFIRNIQSHH